jgi:methylamine dehydrogenase accessory protein MauD
MEILIFIARSLLGAVFLVSGVAKLSDLQGTRQALIDFHLPVRLAVPASFVLPAGEFVIAIALVSTAKGGVGSVAAFVFLLLTSAGIAVSLANGRRPVCRCFGQIDSTPIGWQTLVRNGVLAGVAGFILSQAWVTRQYEAASILKALAMNVQAAIFVVIGLALVGALVAGGWFIYRLQRRLASLEKKLATMGIPLAPGLSNSADGLAVGARAPDFRLTGLDGDMITLDRLRSAGKPVVLVFTDTECGPCTHLLPTLASWQRAHAAHLTIVNISRGPLEANRAKIAAHHVANTLIPSGAEVIRAYRAFAIPSAVLVRTDGTIGSMLALGEEAIGALIDTQVLSTRLDHDVSVST